MTKPGVQKPHCWASFATKAWITGSGPRTWVSGAAGAEMARDSPASNPPETVAPARRKSRRLSAFLFPPPFRLVPLLSFMVRSSLGSTGVSDSRNPAIGPARAHGHAPYGRWHGRAHPGLGSNAYATASQDRRTL